MVSAQTVSYEQTEVRSEIPGVVRIIQRQVAAADTGSNEIAHDKHANDGQVDSQTKAGGTSGEGATAAQEASAEIVSVSAVDSDAATIIQRSKSEDAGDYATQNLQLKESSQTQQETTQSNVRQPVLQQLIKFKIARVEGKPSDQGCSGSASSGVEAIYLEKEEPWIGVNIDEDNVDLTLYEKMKDFLKQYFQGEDSEETLISERSRLMFYIKQVCGVGPESINLEESMSVEEIELLSKSEEEVVSDEQIHSERKGGVSTSSDIIQLNPELRMIPGGRYGCT